MYSIQKQPIVSVCIPTFDEEKYIVPTIKKLLDQSVFVRNEAEIVVADYDPDRSLLTTGTIEAVFADTGKIRMIKVMGKGIAHARNVAIKNALGRYIVNFDADTKFNRLDAIDLLLQPLISNSALFTCCDNVFPPEDLRPETPQAIYINACCMAQKVLPVAIFEPGLSFSKALFEQVGGFGSDITWAEGLALTRNIFFQYGARAKQQVDEVTIITDPRRAKAFDKLGFNIFDYATGIREQGKIVKT